MSNMSLSTILETTKTYGDYHTHVSMGELTGTFCIQRDIIEKFYKAYNKEKGVKGLAEKVQTFIPVLVDIDLNKEYKEDELILSLYNENQLISVVRDFQEVIKTIIEDYEDKHGVCCVLEKPSYNIIGKDGKTYIKNGFHLHFPYVFLEKRNHETYLMPRVKKLLDKGKAFKNLGIENASELYDCCYVNNPWLMYGSQKNKESGCYKLTKIYNDELEEITLEQAFKNYKIYDSNECEIEMKTEKEIKYNLPRILSVIPWFRQITEINPKLSYKIINTSNNQQLITKNSTIKYKEIEITLEIDVDENGNIVKNRSEDEKDQMIQMLRLINPQRFKDWNSWICLCFLIKGNGLPVDLFLSLSENSGFEQYDKEDCLSKWYEIRPNEICPGFGVLWRWIKEDGIQYRSNKIENLKTTDEDFAQYIINSLEGSYLYDEIQKILWMYNTDNCLWVHRDIDYIMTIISSILTPIINDSDIPNDCIKVDKEDTPEIIKVKKQKRKDKFIKEIKSYTFQNKISKLCMSKFKLIHSSDFIRKTFDNKKGIIALSDNKVIVLKEGQVRQRAKEDYFTKLIDRKIVQVSDQDRKYIYELFESFLINHTTKIKPSKNHVENLFYSIAYSLTGENNLKMIVNLIGEPDGGKSFFLYICSLIFGSFSGQGNKRVFVESKSESSHDTDIFALLGKRMCSISETKAGQKANEPFLKACSGNDWMSLRKAYAGENISILLQCILWIATNHPLQTTDAALMRRLACFNFCNKFTDNPSIKEKVLSLSDEIFTIICEYSKQYYDNGMKFDIAEEVKDYTKYLCNQQNTIKVWIDTDKAYEYTEDEKDICERGETYDDYCQFMTGTGLEKLKKITFYREFEKHFNLPEATMIKRAGKSFMGYRCLKKMVSSSAYDVQFEE